MIRAVLLLCSSVGGDNVVVVGSRWPSEDNQRASERKKREGDGRTGERKKSVGQQADDKCDNWYAKKRAVEWDRNGWSWIEYRSSLTKKLIRRLESKCNHEQETWAHTDRHPFPLRSQSAEIIFHCNDNQEENDEEKNDGRKWRQSCRIISAEFICFWRKSTQKGQSTSKKRGGNEGCIRHTHTQCAVKVNRERERERKEDKKLNGQWLRRRKRTNRNKSNHTWKLVSNWIKAMNKGNKMCCVQVGKVKALKCKKTRFT